MKLLAWEKFNWRDLQSLTYIWSKRNVFWLGYGSSNIFFLLKQAVCSSSEGAGFVLEILWQVRFLWVVSWWSCFTELSWDYRFIYLSNVSLFQGTWAESLICNLYPKTNSSSVSQHLCHAHSSFELFTVLLQGQPCLFLFHCQLFLWCDWYIVALIHSAALQIFLIVPATSNNSHINVHIQLW